MWCVRKWLMILSSGEISINGAGCSGSSTASLFSYKLKLLSWCAKFSECPSDRQLFRVSPLDHSWWLDAMHTLTSSKYFSLSVCLSSSFSGRCLMHHIGFRVWAASFQCFGKHYSCHLQGDHSAKLQQATCFKPESHLMHISVSSKPTNQLSN
jgi:hypothetical protein